MTKYSFDDVTLDVVADGKAFAVTWDGESHRVEVLDAANGRLDLLVDGQRVVAYISSDGQDRWVTIDGRTSRLKKTGAGAQRAAGRDADSNLAAPMPGQVRAVNVAPGDKVTQGQVLVVLEAMKMEIRLQAPFDGQVASVDARVGQTVEREQVLVKMERAEAAEQREQG